MKLVKGIYYYIGILLAGMMLMPMLVYLFNDKPEEVFSKLHQFRVCILCSLSGLWILSSILIMALNTKDNKKAP